MNVPMAKGDLSPVWPLPAVTRKRWTFGAGRGGGARRHVGVDLYAPALSEVLATESGRLIRTHRFLGPKAVALLVQTDSGIVINYGEVFPNSWEQYGLKIGDRVQKGQPIAQVGITPGGKSMLHFETYAPGTTSTKRWMAGEDPPHQILNPTDYLKTAEALDGGQSDDGDDSDDSDEADPGDSEDHDHDMDDHDAGGGDVSDPVVPMDPVTPTRPTPGIGRVALVLLALTAFGGGGRR